MVWKVLGHSPKWTFLRQGAGVVLGNRPYWAVLPNRAEWLVENPGQSSSLVSPSSSAPLEMRSERQLVFLARAADEVSDLHVARLLVLLADLVGRSNESQPWAMGFRLVPV